MPAQAGEAKGEAVPVAPGYDPPPAMDTVLLLAVVAVAVVLVFDYTNGFHDAANIVASVIASRAMTPVQAVLIVAVFEFLGPLLGGTAVANTIGKFIELDDMAPATALTVILCGLIGAIAWNLVTWWRGIPSSSSHALVGGLAGAVVACGVGHLFGSTLMTTVMPRMIKRLGVLDLMLMKMGTFAFGVLVGGYVSGFVMDFRWWLLGVVVVASARPFAHFFMSE